MFEQDRVIVRLQQRVLREESIVLCFLAGSFGRGKADIYSDLDVVLGFPDLISRDKAYEGRREFIQSVLPYVPAKSFDANHVLPYLHIALYSNGAKVDYQFEVISSLEQSDVFENIRLLKDEIGWADRFPSQRKVSPVAMASQTISTDQITDLDDRFWVMYMDIFRLLLRGDFDKAYPIYLQLLNFTIPQILVLLPVGSPTRLKLIDVLFNQDTRITLKHFRDLLPAYLAARSEIVGQYDLTFTVNRHFEREILTLIEKT